MTAPEASAPNNKPVAAYLAATGLSLLGNALITVVLPWIVLQRHGASTAAMVAAAAGLPTALGALFGGRIVNRWGRRRISVCADLFSGASVAAMALVDVTTGLTPLWFVVLAASGALLDIPGASAREALVADVASISGTSLERLAGLRGTLFGAAFLIGPPAAGLLLGALPNPLLLTGVAALSLGASWVGRHIPAAAPTPMAALDRARPAAWRTITQDKALRGLLIVAVATTLASRPFVTLLLPAHFQALRSPAALGLTLAAYAAGAAVGSGLFAKYSHQPRRRWWVGSNLACAACLAVISVLPPTAWLAASMAVLGAAGAPVQALTTVILAEHTPEHLRGTVFTFFASTGFLAAPIALTLAGVILRFMDPAQLTTTTCAAWALVCLGSLAMVRRLGGPVEPITAGGPMQH